MLGLMIIGAAMAVIGFAISLQYENPSFSYDTIMAALMMWIAGTLIALSGYLMFMLA